MFSALAQPPKLPGKPQELELPIATPLPKKPTAAMAAQPRPAPWHCRVGCDSEGGRKNIEFSFEIVDKSRRDS